MQSEDNVKPQIDPRQKVAADIQELLGRLERKLNEAHALGLHIGLELSDYGIKCRIWSETEFLNRQFD